MEQQADNFLAFYIGGRQPMVTVLSFALLLTLQHPETLARYTVTLIIGASLSKLNSTQMHVIYMYGGTTVMHALQRLHGNLRMPVSYHQHMFRFFVHAHLTNTALVGTTLS